MNATCDFAPKLFRFSKSSEIYRRIFYFEEIYSSQHCSIRLSSFEICLHENIVRNIDTIKLQKVRFVNNAEHLFSVGPKKNALIRKIINAFIPVIFLHFYCIDILGPRSLGPKEIDGLLVPPGKACSLLYNHLTGLPLRSELAREKWFQSKPSTHISFRGFLGWLYFIINHLLDVVTFSFWVKVP